MYFWINYYYWKSFGWSGDSDQTDWVIVSFGEMAYNIRDDSQKGLLSYCKSLLMYKYKGHQWMEHCWGFFISSNQWSNPAINSWSLINIGLNADAWSPLKLSRLLRLQSFYPFVLPYVWWYSQFNGTFYEDEED